jgi:hypothetical protein
MFALLRDKYIQDTEIKEINKPVIPPLCSLIFDQSVEKVAALFKLKEVEQSLQLLSDKAVSLIQAGMLPLFDANTQTNQCHLIALCITKLYSKSLSQCLTKEDTRFISLAFLISFFFKKNIKEQLKLVFSELKGHPFRALTHFLNSSKIQSLAREQLSKDIHQYIEKELSSLEKNDDYRAELQELAKQKDLFFLNRKEEVQLYCYPKLGGVYLFLKSLEKQPILVLFKIKVISTKKVYIQNYLSNDGCQTIENKLPLFEDKKQPVIVFEGIYNCQSDDSPFITGSNQTTKVPFCCSFENHEKEIKELANPHQMLLFNGAKFIQQFQKEYEKFFTSSHLPQLQSLFEKSLYQSCSVKIEHVHADRLDHALKIGRLIDQTAKEALGGLYDKE